MGAINANASASEKTEEPKTAGYNWGFVMELEELDTINARFEQKKTGAATMSGGIAILPRSTWESLGRPGSVLMTIDPIREDAK